MFNRTSVATITFLLLSSVFFFATAQAQGSGRRGAGIGPDGDGPPIRMLDRLNLSTEQRDRIQALRQTNREEMRAQREATRAAHEHFRSLMQGDASEHEIQAAHARFQELMQAQRESQFQQMLKIREILTPEQREEIGKYRDNRDARGKRGRSGRRLDTF